MWYLMPWRPQEGVAASFCYFSSKSAGSNHHYLQLGRGRQLLGDVGDGLGQGRRVGTDDLVGLLAVLEDEEGGHGADAELLAEVGDLVDVDLDEVEVLVLLLVGEAATRVRQQGAFSRAGT